VQALPIILKELKTRGYHFVRVVPAPSIQLPPKMAEDTAEPNRQPTSPRTFGYSSQTAATRDRSTADIERETPAVSATDEKVATVETQKLRQKQESATVSSRTRATGEPTTASGFVASWLHWIYWAFRNPFR
jgi:hypothetical protein